MQEAKLRALDNDSQLLTFLLENPTLRARFFTQINDALIFEKEAFLDFLKLRILDSSYTRFANKIGLTIQSHTGAKLLKSDSHIVLNFPYKDCILKGAQSKDEDKSNEIFFNEILGSDEIDFLLKPKALQHFELITPSFANTDYCESSPSLASGDLLQSSPSLAEGDKGGGYKNAKDSKNAKFASAESTHPLAPSAREGEQEKCDSAREGESNASPSPCGRDLGWGSHKNLKSVLQNKPNFLIKGNNLLALHTLKSRKDIYGQVKLIYIDPPYNTGNDSFNYNDRFNHSAWLVFMKNRLEIAREFLREDGVIFIQCDDNEQAYLKVLMDEIFGRENFVNCIVVKMNESKGLKNSHIDKRLPKNKEYILIYAKIANNITLNSIAVKKDEITIKKYAKYYNKYIPNIHESCEKWTIQNFDSNLDKMKFADKLIYLVKPDNEIKIDISPNSFGQIVNTKGKVNYYYNDNGKILKALFFGENLTYFLGDLWLNISTININKESGVETLTNAQKPELLLKQILELTTQENDLVMDFFAGSGTTCAVAHKMKRRWVGIEQMDYVESITKERLIKVINGEQGGISKAVGWNPNTPPQTPPAGGGSFSISPSLAEGDKGGGSLRGFEKAEAIHKNAKDSKNAKFASAESTHPLTPSAREGEQNLCHTEGEARSISNDSKEIFRYAQNDNKEVARNNNVKNEFIYFELMPLNALYKQRILDLQVWVSASHGRHESANADSRNDELSKIYKELQEKAFIDYRADKKLPKDSDFEALNLNDKKRILYEILDSNMDYVVYSDIEDSEYGIDKDTIELNKVFYEDNKNE